MGPGVGRNDESLLVGQVPAPILFRPSGNHKVGNFFLLEASVTLFCGVATLCLFTLPMADLFLQIFFCRATGQQWADQIVALVPYARELLLLHPVEVQQLLLRLPSRFPQPRVL